MDDWSLKILKRLNSQNRREMMLKNLFSFIRRLIGSICLMGISIFFLFRWQGDNARNLFYKISCFYSDNKGEISSWLLIVVCGAILSKLMLKLVWKRIPHPFRNFKNRRIIYNHTTERIEELQIGDANISIASYYPTYSTYILLIYKLFPDKKLEICLCGEFFPHIVWVEINDHRIKGKYRKQPINHFNKLIEKIAEEFNRRTTEYSKKIENEVSQSIKEMQQVLSKS